MADQIPQLIDALNKLASGLEHSSITKYTLTGAADWPILVAMGGILVAIIGFMWADLRATIKDHRGEWERSLDKHIADDKEIHNQLFEDNRTMKKDMKDCQDKCCG